MSAVIIINADDPVAFVKLRTILKNTRPLMEDIGEVLEADSNEAFEKQALGDWAWPVQYPNQSDAPFIHVAGALGDFNEGATEPKARRLQRKPALVDTGALASSIKMRVLGSKSVEVGSTHPAAASHNWGIPSEMPVTQGAKHSIVKWLLGKGKAYRKKMLPLIQPARTKLETAVAQRPIFGVTEQAEKDIGKLIEDFVKEGMDGGIE